MKDYKFKVLFTKQNNYYFLYILLLYVLTIYYIFQWPIVAYDNDLWYHLNSGRYILEHKAIPKDSFFSFISPPREWVDYFWLFQVLVYKVYSFFDYHGLVFLRAILFLTVVSIILSFFFKGQQNNKPYLYITIIFSLYFLLFLQRYVFVRPHMFTYLFIALFLYILELKPKKVFYLPALAILWTNLHGIIYPIMLLIVLAYLVEFFISHIKDKTHIQKNELFYIIPLILSIAAVYLTPHGSNLTWVPLIPTGFASLYIRELQYITMDDLFSFQIKTLVISDQTIFNLLFIVACLAVITVLFRRNGRISHFLMFAGGIVLLTKGYRFRFEFALLVMPVLKDFWQSVFLVNLSKKIKEPVKIFFIIMIMIIPLVYVKSIFTNLPKFPFSHRNLPHGITVFLQKVNTGGNVLNHPNNGGYLQWMLYPRYKIFMDMEVPFLFTNEDFYTVQNVYSNKVFLERVIFQYSPSFITVSIKNHSFKELISDFPQYRIVFFDDHEVLYANSEHYPSIVSTHELKRLDPFRLAQSSVSSIKALSNVDPIREELLKIIAVYPDNGIANQCLAILYNKEGKYEKATAHSDNIIVNYPESPTGYTLKGDSFKGLEMYDRALENYKQALKRQDVAEIRREIGMIYFRQNKYSDAYHTLVKAMDIYAPGTTHQDLYYLIVSALESGKIKEAGILFRYAYQSVPPGDKEWYEKYQELQTKIQEPGARSQNEKDVR